MALCISARLWAGVRLTVLALVFVIVVHANESKSIQYSHVPADR